MERQGSDPYRLQCQLDVLDVPDPSKKIYKASRKIKKMQKLSSKILTLWYENMSVSNFVFEETRKNPV